MKKYILAMLVILVLIVFPRMRVSAQQCTDFTDGHCVPSNVSGVNPCASTERSEPRGVCPQGAGKFGNVNPSVCCVNKNAPTLTCSLVQGQCKGSCNLMSGGEFSRGQLDCSTGQQCCVTQSVSIPPGSLGGSIKGSGPDIFCEGNSGVKTALGCISTDPAGFITKFLGFGVGIAGGIAFLLILFGGFQIITSAGNPEQLNAGKELISSAIAGLLLIIFSILLLKIIGFNILGIPDFS